MALPPYEALPGLPSLSSLGAAGRASRSPLPFMAAIHFRCRNKMAASDIGEGDGEGDREVSPRVRTTTAT